MVKHRWILLAAVTVAGFFIDIGTKHLADTRLAYGVPVNVAGEYLQWLLVYNKGAVFGINPSGLIPWLPSNVFFVTFMLCATAFLIFYYSSLKKHEALMHIGLALVLPGAFGNLYDRVFHGNRGVVDFIRMGFPPDNYWFIYNVADVYVTVGVAVMLLNFILEAVGKKKPPMGETELLETIQKEANKEAET
ncbi:MAG: signal peptidase II [Chitinispirillales bacterium]|nr:signal peptidase II [Chitinispirillales bacterium]